MLGLLRNANGCESNLPKVMHFGCESNLPEIEGNKLSWTSRDYPRISMFRLRDTTPDLTGHCITLRAN